MQPRHPFRHPTRGERGRVLRCVRHRVVASRRGTRWRFRARQLRCPRPTPTVPASTPIRHRHPGACPRGFRRRALRFPGQQASSPGIRPRDRGSSCADCLARPHSPSICLGSLCGSHGSGESTLGRATTSASVGVRPQDLGHCCAASGWGGTAPPHHPGGESVIVESAHEAQVFPVLPVGRGGSL